MTVFVAFHPENYVLGSGVLSAVSGIGKEQVEQVCKKHGIVLGDLDKDHKFLQQKELDILRDLNQMDFFNMLSAGMKIPETAPFPPNIQDVHSALASLDIAYQMNVQGEEIGSYEYQRLDDRKALMICNNPYPSDFDYGILYGIVKRFRDSESKMIRVVRDDTVPNRANGGSTCQYTVEW